MNDDRPTRHPDVETAVLAGEAVLYDERSGMVHHLNPAASAIWSLLDGRSVADLVGALTEMTGVPAEQLRADVLQALADFRTAGLLAS